MGVCFFFPAPACALAASCCCGSSSSSPFQPPGHTRSVCGAPGEEREGEEGAPRNPPAGGRDAGIRAGLPVSCLPGCLEERGWKGRQDRARRLPFLNRPLPPGSLGSLRLQTRRLCAQNSPFAAIRFLLAGKFLLLPVAVAVWLQAVVTVRSSGMAKRGGERHRKLAAAARKGKRKSRGPPASRVLTSSGKGEQGTPRSKGTPSSPPLSARSPSLSAFACNNRKGGKPERRLDRCTPLTSRA